MAGTTPRVSLLLTPVLKLVIAAVGLLILQVLVSALPMVREIPVPSGLPLPVLEIVKVVIASVILVLLVNFAFEIEDNLEITFPAFPQGGIIVRWSVLLVAVLLAYGTYRILAETFLGAYVWLYPLVFLGLALVPLVSMVLLSYQHIDKLIGVALTGIQTVSTGGETGRVKGQVRCASCGVVLHPGVKFCRVCGTPASVQETHLKASPQCASCGASLNAGTKFCGDCGAPVAPA